VHDTERSEAYRNFLGLASHEYFHTWNVKRIKPAAFVPYELNRENYTRLLWIFEGFTSYYDDIFLVRTGLVSLEQYLHLLGKTMMPFAKPHLPIGGGKHIINAAQHDHGSSWKMIVDLSGDISAYVVYPGGQSGNPGSRYYDQFAQTWAAGKYYKAWVYKKGNENDTKVKWTMKFN
jgi:hypothetical protein